jgi:hypothetical protein
MTKRLLRRDFMVVTAGAGFAASLSGLLPSSAYRVLAEPALRIGLPGSELAGATIGELAILRCSMHGTAMASRCICLPPTLRNRP